MRRALDKRVAERNARVYLSQSEVPACSLEQAARIPVAIVEEYAGSPTRPLDVAHAMRVQPTTGTFRGLCGAAIAYGLTEGGYNADLITVTDLGRRIATQPAETAEGLAARREAALRPRVNREFLTKYDRSKMPREDVAMKVLESLGVPNHALGRAYNLIVETAKAVNFTKEINGVMYVDLRGTRTVHAASDTELIDSSAEGLTYAADTEESLVPRRSSDVSHSNPVKYSLNKDSREGRVFVTHGRNKELVPQLKELLEFGKFEPVVSVERESVSKPVPDKVLDDMRSCEAAIIHVDADREVTIDGNREVLLSGNVLIEIGAAMALYNRKFILLVREGIPLPSNLQGLYEVRYSGDRLDGDATLRLLKAFKEFQNSSAVRS